MGNCASEFDHPRGQFAKHGVGTREITMDDDNAGWQGQSSTCGIYALNNVLDDALRSEHGVSDYDPEKGALMMRDQGYTCDGEDGSEPIENAGCSIPALLEQVNASIQNGMVLPTHDGRGVTFTLDSECNEGISNVKPGQIVLAKEYGGGGNHFMEIASFDGETITTVNSWQGQEEKTVPDDDTFEEALYTYTIIISDVQQGGNAVSNNDADSDEDNDNECGDGYEICGTGRGAYYWMACDGYDPYNDGYYWYWAHKNLGEPDCPDNAEWYWVPQ